MQVAPDFHDCIISWMQPEELSSNIKKYKTLDNKSIAVAVDILKMTASFFSPQASVHVCAALPSMAPKQETTLYKIKLGETKEVFLL